MRSCRACRASPAVAERAVVRAVPPRHVVDEDGLEAPAPAPTHPEGQLQGWRHQPTTCVRSSEAGRLAYHGGHVQVALVLEASDVLDVQPCKGMS